MIHVNSLNRVKVVDFGTVFKLSPKGDTSIEIVLPKYIVFRLKKNMDQEIKDQQSTNHLETTPNNQQAHLAQETESDPELDDLLDSMCASKSFSKRKILYYRPLVQVPAL